MFTLDDRQGKFVLVCAAGSATCEVRSWRGGTGRRAEGGRLTGGHGVLPTRAPPWLPAPSQVYQSLPVLTVDTTPDNATGRRLLQAGTADWVQVRRVQDAQGRPLVHRVAPRCLRCLRQGTVAPCWASLGAWHCWMSLASTALGLGPHPETRTGAASCLGAQADASMQGVCACACTCYAQAYYSGERVAVPLEPCEWRIQQDAQLAHVSVGLVVPRPSRPTPSARAR